MNKLCIHNGLLFGVHYTKVVYLTKKKLDKFIDEFFVLSVSTSNSLLHGPVLTTTRSYKISSGKVYTLNDHKFIMQTHNVILVATKGKSGKQHDFDEKDICQTNEAPSINDIENYVARFTVSF